MIDVLHFVFSGPWTFIGVCILLGACFDGIASIIRAFRGKP